MLSAKHIIPSQGARLFAAVVLLVVVILPGAGGTSSVAAAQVSTNGSGERSVQLTGRVTDARAGAPLAAVNVFISNTTRGTTTDSTGHYSLRVPPGSYDLVATIVGYETKTAAVTAGPENQVLRRDFELTPTIYELSELRVEDTEDRRWQERFERFREEFLGRSSNVRRTRIENPYVIDFEVDHRGTLTASADRPLTIINGALGYRILFQLEQFAHNERLDIFRYRGWSSYQPR